MNPLAAGCAFIDGVPGPLMARLAALYWSKQEAGWHGTPVDYAD